MSRFYTLFLIAVHLNLSNHWIRIFYRASQPRNAILGQTISISIALGMMYTSLDTNLRKSLGTALAICIMARLGVTHPPAGAAALIFTGGGYSWGHMGIMLAGNISNSDQ